MAGERDGSVTVLVNEQMLLVEACSMAWDWTMGVFSYLRVIVEGIVFLRIIVSISRGRWRGRRSVFKSVLMVWGRFRMG